MRERLQGTAGSIAPRLFVVILVVMPLFLTYFIENDDIAAWAAEDELFELKFFASFAFILFLLIATIWYSFFYRPFLHQPIFREVDHELLANTEWHKTHPEWVNAHHDFLQHFADSDKARAKRAVSSFLYSVFTMLLLLSAYAYLLWALVVIQHTMDGSFAFWPDKNGFMRGELFFYALDQTLRGVTLDVIEGIGMTSAELMAAMGHEHPFEPPQPWSGAAITNAVFRSLITGYVIFKLASTVTQVAMLRAWIVKTRKVMREIRSRDGGGDS